MPVSVSYFQKLTPKWGISETVTDENFNNYVFFFVLQETTHNLRAFRDLQHYTLAIFLQTQSISVFVFYHSKFAKFLPLQYLFQIIWIWIYFHKLKVKIPLPTAYQHYTVFHCLWISITQNFNPFDGINNYQHQNYHPKNTFYDFIILKFIKKL